MYEAYYPHSKTESPDTQPLAWPVQSYWEDIPQLSCENEFDPEQELVALRRMPSGPDKETALGAYKENLIRQKRAWAQAMLCIEDYLTTSENPTSEDCVHMLQQFTDRYHFPGKRVHIAKTLINNFFSHESESRVYANGIPRSANRYNISSVSL